MGTPTTATTTGSRNLVIHTLLALLAMTLGLAGVLYMIFVEDDPPLIPMLVLAAGIGWLVFARLRLKPQARAVDRAVTP